VPTLPVSKVDELSFALDDLASTPPEVQRANIISLMELRAPGTLGAGSQEAMLEQSDQTGLLSHAQQGGIQQGGNQFVGNGAVPAAPMSPAVIGAQSTGATNFGTNDVSNGPFATN